MNPPNVYTDNIIAQAAAELREFGTADFSLRRIASRAGVSHAAPYRHFKDREELLAALTWETQEAFTTALRDARERSRGSSLQRLLRISEAYLEFARENPERLSLMFSDEGMAASEKYPVPRTPEANARYGSFNVLEATVKECQADGILDPRGNSGAISILVWSMVHGLSAIEHEGYLESLGKDRGYTAEKTQRLVLGAFSTLVSRSGHTSRPK